jgi:4-aminobutyrate aminotransferase-like enzyme
MKYGNHSTSPLCSAFQMPPRTLSEEDASRCARYLCPALYTIEAENLIENARRIGDVLKNRFDKLMKDYQVIGDVRGKGLSIGVELLGV